MLRSTFLRFAAASLALLDLPAVTRPRYGGVLRVRIAQNQPLPNPVTRIVVDLAEKPEPARAESPNTTHFSIVDGAGNRVAATVTINLLFGAGIVASGTGVLLNNEMDDFSVRPDVANAVQLRGSVANRIEPGKRPLSSMTPTFVEDEKGVLVLGAPGGSRIVSQVLLAIVEYVHASRVDLAHLVGMPRYHHQFQPDRLEVTFFENETALVTAFQGNALDIAYRVSFTNAETLEAAGNVTQSVPTAQHRQISGLLHGATPAERARAARSLTLLDTIQVRADGLRANRASAGIAPLKVPHPALRIIQCRRRDCSEKRMGAWTLNGSLDFRGSEIRYGVVGPEAAPALVLRKTRSVALPSRWCPR